jgi:streptogramin lyase
MRFCASLIFIILMIVMIGGIVGEEYDPKFEEARVHFKKGFRLFNRCRYIEAIEEYTKALDLAPHFGLAWYWIGKAYYKVGLNEQAILCWKRFIDLKGPNKELERKIQILFFEDYKIKDEPLVYRHLGVIPEARFRKGDFYNPTSLAIDGMDNIYVVNSAGATILKFSPTGEPLLEFGKGELTKPFGIAIDGEGNIWVSDFGEDLVKKFSPQGKLIAAYGGSGREDGKFLGPQGITIDQFGNIYVVDTGNARIQKFDRDGKFLMKLGRRGNLAGCFSHPVDLVVEGDGEIWVTDSANQRIQKFDSSGNFLAEFRLPHPEGEPRGISADKEGIIYISDANGRIYRFKPALGEWQPLQLEGANPLTPIDVGMNRHGYLYVASFGTHSIEVFIPPEHLRRRFDVFIDRVITDHYPIIAYCVTVTGGEKMPIPGLTSENFKISEQGRPVSPIAVKNPLQKRENLLAVFVIDTSKEMAKYMGKIKEVVFAFIEKMKEGRDAGAVVAFSDRIHYRQELTMNKDRLTYGVGTLKYGRRFIPDLIPRAIHEGVTNTLDRFGRKVVILFTYGLRGDTKTTLMNEVLNYARNNSVQVMVIDFHEGEEVDEGLRRFAHLTNGVYLLAHRSPERLANLLDEARELTRNQSQYILFYETTGEKFSGRWVEGAVASGYGRLYGEDLGGYIVP